MPRPRPGERGFSMDAIIERENRATTGGVTMAAKLNDQQVATILHGLRMIQCEGRIEGCLAGDCEHFEDVAEMSNEEIDELCEAINCGYFDPPETIQPKELRKLIRVLKRTFDGDSNDAEHDAAVELVDYLEEHQLKPLKPAAV